MATLTENEAITGSELKEIIMQRISKAMDRDCTLTDDIAYAGFALDFQINMKFLRSKTDKTLVWGNEVELAQGMGKEALVDLAAAPSVQVTDKYESDSPNMAREEHDLPIPVYVNTANGPERRKIHVNKGKRDA